MVHPPMGRVNRKSKTETKNYDTDIIAVCKDSYVVYACGFDRNGKWEWFCESKLCCKNVMLQKWPCKMTSQTSTTLFADGIISDNSFNFSGAFGDEWSSAKINFKAEYRNILEGYLNYYNGPLGEPFIDGSTGLYTGTEVTFDNYQPTPAFMSGMYFCLGTWIY